MSDRVRNEKIKTKIMSPKEAALFVKDGMTVGASGFTLAGYPKAVPIAIAERTDDFKFTLITGASVGDELDGVLARSGVLKRRYPYQTNSSIRDMINDDMIDYVDMHLSHVPFWIKHGYMGNIDLAIIEAVAIDEEGNIIPSTSVGCSNILAEYADKIIVEINTTQPLALEGMHDIYSPCKVPNTKPIPIEKVYDRIGTPYIKCDADKIVAVVFCDIPDDTPKVPPLDEDAVKMAGFLVNFLKQEVAKGRLPQPLPPLQSGVGSVANAILGGLKASNFKDLTLYSEVLQDSVLDLIDCGCVNFASGTAFCISPEKAANFYENIDSYRGKMVLRPEEISNSPEVIRRLGVIAINTAIEADFSGNINSTHIGGTRVMNGIGGSGDFARNALLTIFTTSSTAKGGSLSCIVPAVSHVDHTEHDVHIIITEQGISDLRGLTPYERAKSIIDNCAHPKFRPALYDCLDKIKKDSVHKHGIPMHIRFN